MLQRKLSSNASNSLGIPSTWGVDESLIEEVEAILQVAVNDELMNNDNNSQKGLRC
jgi:hypothetical protein